MKKNYNCDYLIIGSGASGSVAAYELTKKKKDVLIIEEGSKFNISHFKKNIFDSFLTTWKYGGVTPVFGSPSFGFGEAKCYGGGTFINGGLIWRTPNIILEEWKKKLSSDLYKYENLEKYFKIIENKLSVSKETIRNDNENNDSKILLDISKKNNLRITNVPRAVKNCIRSNVCSIGCPSNAKQSTVQNYLLDAEKNNLRVLTDIKIVKFLLKNNLVYKVVGINNKGEKIDIFCKNLILAAGPINTPILLKNSIKHKTNFHMEIHMNFRVNVFFNKKINSENGTIFTHQIQEFIEDGVLIMPTNFNSAYLFSSLTGLSNQEILDLKNKTNQMASYVIQIRSKNKVKIFNFKHHPILFYDLDISDFSKLKKYLKILCSALFDQKAKKIYLPLQKNNTIYSVNEIEKKLIKNNIHCVSVHGMASNAMGNNHNSNFNLDGRHHEIKNLYCIDSSILPSSTIESPQGTIMAVAHSILDRII